jgi:hypothetical protein
MNALTTLDPVEFRKQWLIDLRSDKYPQTTRGNLKDHQGYCCLGVAADQLGPKWVGKNYRMIPVLEDGTLLSDGGIETNRHSGKLSDEFLKRIGVNSGQATALMAKNDGGDTFHQLADFIESDEFAQIRPIEAE